MILVITTGRLGELHGHGENNVDITVRNNTSCLAPTWDLVGGHKRFVNPEDTRWHRYQALNDEQYTELYIELLRARFKKDRKQFYDLIAGKEITLACYCEAGHFCHRHIAVSILKAITESPSTWAYFQGERIEVIEAGELRSLHLRQRI